MTKRILQSITLSLVFVSTHLPAQPVELPPLVVTATHVAQPAETLPISVDVFTHSALRSSPALTIDDRLRASAAFSLFRRSGSLTANPTAQGVSLRGLGPSGASRSLVLLDGVPLNDPFGGWVAWTKLPRLSLDRAEIVRGGGSAAWGNAALGGTVQLLTPPLEENCTELEAMAGDRDTCSGEFALSHRSDSGRHALRVNAAAFSTDGFHLVRDRGAIDRAADSEYQRAQASWESALSEAVSLTITGRGFAEDRGNGTPLQRNVSRESFLSAALAGTPAGGPSWSGVVYAQDQSFQSFFSSINAARTAEAPANNQYDVPATAAGGAFTATWAHDGNASTTAGADLRWVEGETHEDYLWNGAAFTRRRFAGGEQAFVGAFARHERLLAPGWRGSIGARLDSWENTDGFRLERNTTTGAITRDDSYPDREGVEFSPNLGLVWQASKSVRARASIYRAFRLPTLNEYYRPFRVGSVTTDANPDLVMETLSGGEIGLDLGTPKAGLSFTAYLSEISDAVANVTTGPNTRQRRNLDRVRGQGLEIGAHVRPHSSLRLDADFLLSDSRVVSGKPSAEFLDGNRLAQVPRHTLTAGATWDAHESVRVTARLRYASEQFEDDENTLVLAEALTADLAMTWTIHPHTELFAAAENLFDAEVQTGRNVEGVVSIAPSRFVRGGVRWTW